MHCVIAKLQQHSRHRALKLVNFKVFKDETDDIMPDAATEYAVNKRQCQTRSFSRLKFKTTAVCAFKDNKLSAPPQSKDDVQSL
jgi:hypothetical protein